MSAADIVSSLRQVFSTLQEIQKVENGEITLAPLPEMSEEVPPGEKPALFPKDSIQNDKVICLDCGAEMKQLTVRHLSSHSMTPKEYKKKYGFTMRTPLAAKALTKARSKAAKKRGLPENLAKYHEARKQQKSQAKAPIQSDGPKAARVKNVRQRFSPKKAQ